MSTPRPPDFDNDAPIDDMISVALAERLADDQARRAADRARLPSFFFGLMFTAALGGLFLRDVGAPEGGEASGLEIADAALIAFAGIAAVMGVFGEERVRSWFARGRDGTR